MKPKKTDKEATSYRMSPEAKRLLSLLAERLGVSRHAVLEMALREMAARFRVE